MYTNAIQNSGLRIRVVERTGGALKSELQRSNPFATGNCGRADCFVCTTTGKGNCNTESVTYTIECMGENCSRRVYVGETASNAYTRGAEHLGRLAARNIDQSPLWRHCVDEHGGEMQEFGMRITGSYRNDTMIWQIKKAVKNRPDWHKHFNEWQGRMEYDLVTTNSHSCRIGRTLDFYLVV